jgi:tRNA pseudouridine55 synthase
MDGIFNINKPSGRTSFSIVAMVRRWSGERRAGHAGTLDPAADGVLPVCLGQGTRVVEFLMDATKTYLARIELGVSTDTYDATGNVTSRGDYTRISREQLETALGSFLGLISQTPPMYSAVKYHGRPLYELARAGIIVNRASRPAKIHQIKLVDFNPPVLTIEVICGKGTYIRSLAHDLGQALGCGGSLQSLTRLRCGPFDLRNAISVPQLEDALRCGYWRRFVYPIDTVLLHWEAMLVGEDEGQVIKRGCSLELENSDASTAPETSPRSAGNRCRVYTDNGCFLGVVRFNPEKRQWQPEKVFLT